MAELPKINLWGLGLFVFRGEINNDSSDALNGRIAV